MQPGPQVLKTTVVIQQWKSLTSLTNNSRVRLPTYIKCQSITPVSWETDDILSPKPGNGRGRTEGGGSVWRKLLHYKKPM